MTSIDVQLRIAADEYLKLYRGVARTIIAKSTDGRTVRFPAGVLQPFVTHKGVEGLFRIQFDADNRFQSINKLG